MSIVKEEDVNVSEVPITGHEKYMDHEVVYRIESQEHGITAFVGVHNTALGPGLGGIRYKHYESEDAALTDVLRLSEAMTWKNAAGGLEFGGGKTVLLAPKGSNRAEKEALEVLSLGLNKINKPQPMYHGAEDMNINEEALNYMIKITPWINGATSNDPNIVGGTPSPLTAIGVFECMKVAARHKLGKDSLKGLRITMQGLGSVGSALAKHLHNEGAILSGADISDAPFEALEAEGVTVERVGLDEIYDTPADIFAPNAIGGTLTNKTVECLQNAGVQIVCGAANNQQEDQITFVQSKLMHDLGLLYCPDYIVNAGGVIWVAKVGENAEQTTEDIRTGVPRRFQDVLDLQSQNPDKDMATIAAEYSRKRVETASKQTA